MDTLILVPHLNGIEPECERGLDQLESKVWRRCGSSAIDIARNEMASDALHHGFEAIFFIDSDISFDPRDVVRLINSPEPVISGVYAKKGKKELASVFMDKPIFDGTTHKLKYAATGFLRIKATVLREMIDKLKLPLCNTQWGRGIWPFFQPLITDELHYLGEDWAFSHRLHQIGVTPLVDTSIELIHWGRHGYGVKK